MPKPYPEEFRRGVVAVARRDLAELCEELAQQADIEDGHQPGSTRDESAELREARKRIPQFEQEAEVMRRAVAYFSRDINPK